MKHIRIFVILLFLGANCASAPRLRGPVPARGDYKAVLARLNPFLKEWMSRNGAEGLSLSIVQGDRVLLARGYGLSDREKNIPARADTRFMVGSVGKLFTATAIMLLVQEGKVELDAPVRKYLPEFRVPSRFKDAREVTVLDLLSHRGGIPGDYLQNFAALKKRPGFDTLYRKLPATLKKENMLAKPGSIFAYSNTGYSLLGLIIEKVSGLSFYEFTERRVFRPLGMKGADFRYPAVNAPKTSWGYMGDGKMRINVRDVPAGSVFVSADDMALFLRMILNEGRASDGKTFLKKETLAAMFRPRNKNSPLDGDFRIGLGYWHFSLRSLGGRGAVGHGGDIGPYHAMLVVLPGEKLGAAVSVNSLKGSSMELGKLASRILGALLEARTGRRLNVPPPAEPLGRTEARYLKYAGDYATPMGFVRVRPRGKDLRMELFGSWFNLVQRKDSAFSARLRLLGGLITVTNEQLDAIRLRFETVQGMKVARLFVNGLAMGLAQKVAPLPVSSSWKNRSGSYRILNPGHFPMVKNFRLEYSKEEGYLFLSYQSNIPGSPSARIVMPLRVLNDREAALMGLGRNMGSIIRARREISRTGSPGAEILHFSGFRLRRKP